MTQASFSNGAYTLQNVHFPNLYMTDIGPSNVGGNPVGWYRLLAIYILTDISTLFKIFTVVGLPQDADTTVVSLHSR